MEDRSETAAAARPFHLRPSILSGSGFGAPPPAKDNAASQKGFMLRPSALTAAADKIENSNESRKRSHTDEHDEEAESAEQKKSKVLDKSESMKTTRERLNLTEVFEKPQGIGTFGFCDKKKSDTEDADEEKSKESLEKSKSSTNYFQQSLSNSNTSVRFAFGNTTGSSETPSSSSDSNIFTATASSSNMFSDQKKDNDSEDVETKSEKELSPSKSDNKALLDSEADKYAKSKDDKVHLDEVESFTGEEGENHVLHILCKLHVFDKERKSWVERGRGTLRLNDICQSSSKGIFQSRIVFRTQGANIVQLNTMLYPDMNCESVNEKSVRITAIDPETKDVRIYLITTNKKDAIQTLNAINGRIEALKRNRDMTSPGGVADDDSNDGETKSRTDDEDSCQGGTSPHKEKEVNDV